MNPRNPTNNDPRPTPTAHEHERRLTIDAHANAHAPAHDTAPDPPPVPAREARRISRRSRVALLAKKITDKIPRGHRNIADHLSRAASNTLLLLAEGANVAAPHRSGSGSSSRGECAEVAAAADLLVALEIGHRNEVGEMKALAGRVSAMLTKLIARLE